MKIEPLPDLPAFMDVFAGMCIPGRTGFSVVHSSEFRLVGISFGKDDDGFQVVRLNGEFREIDRVTSPRSISKSAYEGVFAAVASLTGINGSSWAENALGGECYLDGECYYVRILSEDSESRFILGNPNKVNDEEARRLGVELRKLLKFRWRWLRFIGLGWFAGQRTAGCLRRMEGSGISPVNPSAPVSRRAGAVRPLCVLAMPNGTTVQLPWRIAFALRSGGSARQSISARRPAFMGLTAHARRLEWCCS